MIRVIIGYKIKKNADTQPILNKLRAHAMTYPGFIGAENLQNVKDSSIVAMFQTWDRLEDWLAWEPSIIRKAILDEAKPILHEDPRVTIFRVIPTSGWGYPSRES